MGVTYTCPTILFRTIKRGKQNLNLYCAIHELCHRLYAHNRKPPFSPLPGRSLSPLTQVETIYYVSWTFFLFQIRLTNEGLLGVVFILSQRRITLILVVKTFHWEFNLLCTRTVDPQKNNRTDIGIKRVS